MGGNGDFVYTVMYPSVPERCSWNKPEKNMSFHHCCGAGSGTAGSEIICFSEARTGLEKNNYGSTTLVSTSILTEGIT
jgi:hypothetical protein